MELASMYIGIHKNIHPWLKDYLFGSKEIPWYQQKIIKAAQENKPLHFDYGHMIGRGSGKSGLHLAYLQSMIEAQTEPTVPTLPRIQIANEFIEDGAWNPVSNMITAAARQFAIREEERLWNSLGVSPILFENGSRIQPIESRDVVRGQSYHRFRPTEFVQEYLSEWVGDSDGDVPPVYDDRTFTEES